MLNTDLDATVGLKTLYFTHPVNNENYENNIAKPPDLDEYMKLTRHLKVVKVTTMNNHI